MFRKKKIEVNVTTPADFCQTPLKPEEGGGSPPTEDSPVFAEIPENDFSDAAKNDEAVGEEVCLVSENARLVSENVSLQQEIDRLRCNNTDLLHNINALLKENNKLKADISGLPQAVDTAWNTQKSEIDGNVLRLERNLISILDVCRADLGSFRDTLEKTLYDMRFDIYNGDFGLLAGAYQKLFDYVKNILPRLRDENRFDWETNSIRLSRYLHNLLDGFTRAGLTVIIPNEGELFDSNVHVAANAQNVDDEEDIPIVSMVYPGFKKGDYVICRAAVNLAPHSDDEIQEELCTD